MKEAENRLDRPWGKPRRWAFLGIALVAVVTMSLLRNPILTGIASFLTIRDPLERVDFILPLYNGADTVPFAAADLYHRGYASRILLGQIRPGRLEVLGLQPSRHEVWRRVLEGKGVPPEAIATIGFQIENDLDLARAVAAVLPKSGKSRVIVVASAPFSRIIRSEFRRGLTGSPIEIRIYPVQPKEFDERNWWRSRHGWITYFDAYFLLALRLLRQ